MNELTSQIKKILETPDNEINLEQATTIFLQVSRNRVLAQNILRKKNIIKLKYELKKVYDFRSKEDARKETQELEKKVIPVIEKTIPATTQKIDSDTKGMRPDHDRLPDEIKSKYLENLNIFPHMRKLHEQLKLMENAKPCDRYPVLQKLVSQDKLLRENWDQYDSHPFVPEQKTTVIEIPEKVIVNPIIPIVPDPEVVDPKKISAARKYLSDNKSKLAELKAQEDPAAYNTLQGKMQDRLSFLLNVNAGVSQDYLKELKELGLGE